MSGLHLRVRVGAELYAVAIENAREVDTLGEIAQVAGARAGALGVRNYRGDVLPVFDLAALLGAGAGHAQWLLVAEEGHRRAGFAIDEVVDVAPLDESRQEAESELLSEATLVDGELVGVIDLPRLFAKLEQEGP